VKSIKSLVIILSITIFLSNIILPQSDSSNIDGDKFFFNPRFSGFQFEATSVLVVNEIGALVDFDIFSSSNNYYNLGTRLSLEHYDVLSIGAAEDPENKPTTNYNLYTRFTEKWKHFWFSFLLGGTIQTNLLGSLSDSKFYPRVGFELKYNITDYEIGIILKGAKSIVAENGYLGFGVAVGFYSH